ncbi:MAG: 6-hydroxymethylpterin diphosphokinase MptE-like protein [Desulfurella sp.]|uniref:6-hydroxymethylpterin diphosphokinase MptE-like protein n=1 Tax=Desulfurella sp. TaxID=1962857 RepID=UPI003C7769DA
MLEKNALVIDKKATYLKKLLENINPKPIQVSKEIYTKPQLKHEDVVVLSGFGSGHIAKRLIEDFPKNTIICYETDLEGLKYVLDNVDVSDCFVHDNFFFFASDEENIENTITATFNLFVGKFNFGNLQIITNPLLEPSKSQKINDIIQKLYTPILLNRNTLLLKSQYIIENIVKNISDVALGFNLDYLKNRAKNKPALIVASGPSLSNDIETIKKYRDKFIVIAVDSVINILEQNNIKPDIICGLDYQQVTLEKYSPLMKKAQADDSIFVFEPAIFYQIPKLFKNKIYKTEENSFLELLDIKPNYEVFPINAVTHLAVNVAYILGANPIVFVGQDWAYTKAQHHAKGTILPQGLPEKLIWVKGNYEEKVPTDENLFSGLTIMSEIANFLTSKGIQVINATSGGAYIENTQIEKLEEFAKRIKKNATITIKFNKKPSLSIYIKKLKNILLEMNKAIHKADKALKINQNIQKTYEKTKNMEKIRSKVEESNKINNELYNNPVMTKFVFFYYFQEFYNYFKEEIDIENQTLEKRLEQSNKYFELIKTLTQNLIELVQKTIKYLELKNAFLQKFEENVKNNDKLFELLMNCYDFGDIYFGLEILDKINIQNNSKLIFAKAKLLSNYRYFHKHAVELYEKAIELDPDFELARNELAVEKYKIISHLILAKDAILNRNDFITAKRLVERAKDYDPDNEHTIQWLSMINNLEQMQTMQERQKVIKEQLKIEGTIPEYDKAIELLKQNKIDEAYSVLENLNKKYPAFGDALFLMGSILIDKKDFDKALYLLNQAKNLLPYHPFVYVALAKIYMSKEIYDKAKEALETALSLNPALKDEIGENLGDLYYEFGEYEKALSLYESHLQITQDKIKLLMKIALCYKGLGLIQSYNQILSKLQELSTNA